MSYFSKQKKRTDRYQLSWEQASRWLRLLSRLQWHPFADSLLQWSVSAVETFGQTQSQCGTCEKTIVYLHTAYYKDWNCAFLNQLRSHPLQSMKARNRYISFLEWHCLQFDHSNYLCTNIFWVKPSYRIEHYGYSIKIIKIFVINWVQLLWVKNLNTCATYT